MRSTKFHDALRRPAFDIADRRGNNPHGTYEAADAEGRRLNGYRYETVQQVEKALDPRARRLGEATPPPTPPASGGGGGDNGILWLLAAAAGIALWASASSDELDVGDGDGDDGDDGDARMIPEPGIRENPAPAAMTPNITVNLTMPHAPPTTLMSNLSPVSSEPVHVTVPVMAPVVIPPPEPQALPPVPSPAALSPEKKRRKKRATA